MNKQQIVNAISGLIGQGSVLVMSIEILKKLNGDKNATLLLSQIMYWSKRMGKEWFYKTDESWREELFLSEWELRLAKEKLKKLGFINTKLKKAQGLTVLHYSINHDKIYDLLTSDLSHTQNAVCVTLKTEIESHSNAIHILHAENTTDNTKELKSKTPPKTEEVKNPTSSDCDILKINQSDSSLFRSAKNQVPSARDHTKRLVHEFCKIYHKTMGTEHHNLTNDTYKTVTKRIEDQLYLLTDSFEARIEYMFDRFFEMKFRRSADYSLFLFSTCIEQLAERARKEIQ